MLWNNKPLLPSEVQEAVVSAIREAELRTTGEIRIFVEPHCEYMDALERAKEVFSQLGMEQTELRNAILIYVALRDKQFALFGDEAIHQKAGGPSFWAEAAASLQVGLRQGQLKEGLVRCVNELGDALSAHFPHDPDIEKNELPDEIVFGK
jgi:uncharacterized membrane protein